MPFGPDFDNLRPGNGPGPPLSRAFKIGMLVAGIAVAVFLAVAWHFGWGR